MLLSKKLLNAFFPVLGNLSDYQIETMLNAIGVEVESVYKFEKIDNLIVGLITKIEKHPKSEKLNVCTVKVKGEDRIIITGAQNVKLNGKVIVALEGATMVNGITIQKRELLGIESNGMMCGYNELTNRVDFISDEDSQGIILLDSNAKVDDEDPLKYIGFDDTIYDLSLPSNRNDLNGIVALGYDLISIYFPNQKLDFKIDFSKFQSNKFKIVNDSKLNAFFGTIELSDVIVQESSWVLKSYLMASGIKPINWLVDISNLAMIIGGNPSHCYDKDKLDSDLRVQLGHKKQSLVGLDKQTYNTTNKDILIYSGQTPVAIAGVIGLLDSSVTSKTKSVMYEIANFDNVKIKETANRLKIKTNASTLFGKKIPLWITIKTYEILIDLLSKSKAKFKGIIHTPFDFSNNKIELNIDKINTILDSNYSLPQLKKILTQLKFECKEGYVYPPVYRNDIESIQDVAEELVKKININNINPIEIGSTRVRRLNNFEYDNMMTIKNYFIDQGFSLVKTYNLTSIENDKKFNIFNSKELVKLINPISKDREYLRSSLISQHLDVYEYNNAHQNELIPIFEIQNLNYDSQVFTHLGIMIPNQYRKNYINKTYIENDIFLLKSLIKDLFMIFNYEIKFSNELVDKSNNIYVANNSLAILNGNNQVIGYMGQVNPLICKSKKIGKQDFYFAEIRLEEFIKNKINLNFRTQKDNQINKIKRVLSFVIENESVTKLVNALDQSQLLKNWNLIDIYQENENKFVYTIEFEIINNSNKSISIDEINVLFNSIINEFESKNILIKKS